MTEPGPADLLGSWRVTRIGQTDVLEGNPPRIDFGGDGSVHGTTGLNRFTGRYEVTGAALRFSPLATTRMAGMPEVMDQEQRFTVALSAADSARAQGDHIVLGDGDLAIVLRR